MKDHDPVVIGSVHCSKIKTAHAPRAHILDSDKKKEQDKQISGSRLWEGDMVKRGMSNSLK